MVLTDTPRRGEFVLANGITIYWEPSSGGGRSYVSDAIASGVLIWDTTITSIPELETVLRIEREFTAPRMLGAAGLVSGLLSL